MSGGAQSTIVKRMPAEWEPHAATWLAWPHHEPDFPDKLEAVVWVYTEVVRVLIAAAEQVEILCHDNECMDRARSTLERAGVAPNAYRLHLCPTDRSWLRDSAPTGVITNTGELHWIAWQFNAWAKYEDFSQDARVPEFVARTTERDITEPRRVDTGERLVLEGGAIDTDGCGTLLVTEECLLSAIQMRNPGIDRLGYERSFAEQLGTTQTIWLAGGCVGDDTHGHVDDVARFVGPHTVVLAYEDDPSDENCAVSRDNLARLEAAKDATGQSLQVIKLPFPHPVKFDGERLPASYANFYIANRAVLVPTFNDPNDRIALNTLADLFPDRPVIGVHAVDLVWGLGTLHCMTQPQPATRL